MLAGSEDSGTMQALVRSQVYNIVHPISEHMREVQAQVQQLAKRLKETDGRLEETKASMDQKCDEFLSVRRSISNHDTHLEKLQDAMGIAQREKEKLGADHAATKADLSKVAAELRATNALLKSLQQKSEDFDTDIRSLHASATSAGKLVAEEAERSAQTRELAHSLNVRQNDMFKDISELLRSVNENNQGLHGLTQHCEKSNGVLSAELSKHQEHLDSLEGRVIPAQSNIQTNAEAIRRLEERLRLLQPFLDPTSDAEVFSYTRTDGSQMHCSQSGGGDRAEGNSKAQRDAMENLKASLTRLMDQFNAYKDETSQMLKDVDRRVGDNTHRIEGLQAAKESMTEHLRKHDGFLTKLQQNLDAVGGQVDMLQLDFKGMQAIQTDIGNKVEGHRISLAKTQADLKNTNAHVDTANENLLNIKEGLGAMDVTIAKLGSRYDSCSRSLHGVSRGLADVGKHVHQGDHGMLAPKPFNIADVGKPLSHQGELPLGPRSPDVSRALPPNCDFLPTMPPPSPQSRRISSLRHRTGGSLDGGVPSSAR